MTPGPHCDRLLRRTDRPWAAALVALAVAALFVGARLAFAADGRVEAFVLVGSDHVLDRSQLPDDLPVAAGQGYDGQFYYRMAVEPTDLSLRDDDDALALDLELRRTRIGYPALAWAVSGGQASLVPVTLVLVNLVAVGAGAASGAVLAGAAGRHALWGLLPVGWPGLVTTLGRDLTELSAVALVLGGMAALARGRPVAAALAFSAAALCRETALLLVAALLITRAVGYVRRPGRVQRTDLAWCAPVVVFVAWQVVNRLRYGSFPLASAQGNTGTFGEAALGAAVRWVTEPTGGRLVSLSLLLGLLVLVGLSAAVLPETRACPERPLALALAVGLSGSLSAFVWNDDIAQFRTFAEVHVFAACCLLATRRPAVLTTAAVVTTVTWLPVAGLYARAL